MAKRVRIELPDAVYEVYRARAKREGLALAGLLVMYLKRFFGIEPQDRIVIVDAESRRRLEKDLGGGHLQSGEDLADRVGRLAAVSVDGVELELTLSEREQLKRRAEKKGITYEDEVNEVIESMKERFFDYV